jgi:PAT family beta-lactamase induction signal transducer AmpG
MNAPRVDWRQLFTNPRVVAAMTLGFASGLPFNLSQGTLQAWLATVDIDLKTIGLFTLVSAPYTFKVFWAPLVDRYALPFLGRRRGWVLVFQVALAGVIALIGLQSPERNVQLVALLAFTMAFLSASQDIVIDAYRTDTLRHEERGIGSTFTQLGWRLAALISGALALVMSDRIGWHNTYLCLALVMAATMLATVRAPEPERRIEQPATLAAAVLRPLAEFLARPGAWALLALVVLYKFGDAFALSLSTAFLIKGVGFSATEVGAISKTTNLVATILGTLAGGVLFVRFGLYRSLLVFGALQAVTNLLYAWLAAAGRDLGLMLLAVGFDNLAGGMGAAAFGAFIMALCDQRFSAFQFALLSALSSIARTFLGPLAATLVDGGVFSLTVPGADLLQLRFEAIGWHNFFIVTFFTALPGLLLLVAMRSRIERLDVNGGP